MFIVVAWLVLLVAFIAAMMYLVVRSNRVLAFRLDLIRQVGEAAQADIAAGDFSSWTKRYDSLNSVAYDTMLWSLKPLKPEVFYSDTSFLRR